jgi:hypothetical protein
MPPVRDRCERLGYRTRAGDPPPKQLLSRRPVQPRPKPRLRFVLAHPEHASGRLDLVVDAPARDKRARECWIGKVDRDRIVQHPARSRRCHRPAIRTTILVEPGGDSSVLSAETFRRLHSRFAVSSPWPPHSRPAMLASCVAAPACPPMSARSSSSSPSRRIDRPLTSRRAGNVAPTDPLPVVRHE